MLKNNINNIEITFYTHQINGGSAIRFMFDAPFLYFCRLLVDAGMCSRYNAWLHASGRAVRVGLIVISLWLAQRRFAISSCQEQAQLETHVLVTQPVLLESQCAWMLMELSIMGFTSGLFLSFLATPCL